MNALKISQKAAFHLVLAMAVFMGSGGLWELRAQQPEPALRVLQRGGALVIDWDETNTTRVLEVAPDPAGPWQAVAGASAPYTTLSIRPQRYYRLGPGNIGGAGNSLLETFAARAEEKLGVWYMLRASDWMSTKGTRWTLIRSGLHSTAPNYRSMSGHFLATRDNLPLAIFFSAEAYVGTLDKRMFVRALVDGTPVNPGDVVFATGMSPVNPEARAFIFTGRVNKGLHTVELQWLVDSGATAYMRDAAFLVRLGESPNTDSSLITVTPPSGAPVSTTSGSWTDVPGLSGTIQTKAGESLALSVSAESYVAGGGTMFLRALVDGQPAKPGDVLFAKSSRIQCRQMTFGLTTPAAGSHAVRIQWLASQGVGRAFIGDRSLVLAATPKSSADIAQVLVIPDSGAAVNTSSTVFAPIPGMSASGKLTTNCELAVVFSAVSSVAAGETLHVRLKIDGNVVPKSDVQLAQSDMHVGAHAFVFSAKHLYPGGPPANSTISLEWRVANGGTASLDDRSMLLLVKKPTVPDLIDPPAFGTGNFPIEAAVGSRRLLVILWDPHRPGHAAPAVATARAQLFGNSASVKHYYSVVSGGKYSLNNALAGTTVLGWYDASGPSQNYFNNTPGCANDSAGMDLRRREALQRAAQAIDFAAYDDNGDGVLDPQLELGILLVIPESGAPFGKVRQVFNADCTPLQVDGVYVPFIAEVFTGFTGIGYMVAAHELAHLLFGLDDAYVDGNAVNTRMGRLSLMEQLADHTPHLDAFNKLALGWVNPTIAGSDGIYSLRDVKKSQQVLILPRKPGKADDEYFILENRQAASDNTLYDQNISDSGIAVWHIIESHTDNGLPPVCMSGQDWSATGNGNTRRGVRLLRPRLNYSNVWALWNSEYYNLHDTGLICPEENDDPADRRNALLWSHGAASGYDILNWSAAAETMSFQVIAP